MRICCESCITWFDIEPPASLRGARRKLKFRCGRCGAVVMVDNPLAAPDADGVERTENLPLSQLSTPMLPFHAPIVAPEEDVMTTQEVTRESGAAELGSAEPGPAESGLLLKQEGKTYRVKDLATIQRWILERRVLREDLLSREGSRWEPAQSHADLEIFFATIERLEQLESTPGTPGFGVPLPPLPDSVPMGNGLVDQPPAFSASEDLNPAFAMEGELPNDATEEFFNNEPVMLYVPPVTAESPFTRAPVEPAPTPAPAEATAWPPVQEEPKLADADDLPSEPSATSEPSSEPVEEQFYNFEPPPRTREEPRSPALLIILLSCLALAVWAALTTFDVNRDTFRPRRSPRTAQVSPPPAPQPEVPAPAEPVATPEPAPAPEVATPEPAAPPPKPEPPAPQTPKAKAPPEQAPQPKANASALANEGWEAIADRDLARADRLFSEALAARSTHALALYGQGYVAQLRGDEASAVRKYCAALRNAGSDADLTREVSSLIRNAGGSCD